MASKPQHIQRLIGLAVAVAFLALTAAYLWLRFITPSDGAWLEPGQRVWVEQGAVVTRLTERPNGLLSGDVVVAVHGRSMEDWIRTLFAWNSIQPRWREGETVIYTVLRAGNPLEVEVELEPFMLTPVLKRNWSPILFTLFSQLVITPVFLLKPGDQAARALFLWAWSLSHTYTWSIGLRVSDFVDGKGFWLFVMSATGMWLIFWSSGLHFSLVFAKVHPLLVKRPWLVPIIYIVPFPLFLLYLMVARLVMMNPLNWLGVWAQGESLFAFVMLSLTIAFVIQSYRSSWSPALRQRIKWLIFAGILCGGAGIALWLLPAMLLGRPLISVSSLGLVLLPFPLSLAIAVLRHQLFDIDVIINRTLVYSLLTVLLATIYFAGVVMLQGAFRALTGQDSQLAIVVSTLGIAALFTPLRRRVQDFIDRRFYRRKYDIGQTLREFSAKMRDDVDLDNLEEHLLEVVEETMQPGHLSLWLPQADRKTK